MIRRVLTDRRGVTAVEFALVSPLVLLLMMAAIDLGYTLTVQQLLEASAREASRYGITGEVPQGETRREVIRDIVERHTAGLVDMESLDIDTRAYTAFENVGKPEPFNDANGNGQRDSGESYSDVNGNGQWDPDMGRADAGGSGDVVVYTLTYPQPVLIPYMASFYGTETITHRARAVVRNEPF